MLHAHSLLCLQEIPPCIVSYTKQCIHRNIFQLCCSSPSLILRKNSNLHYLQILIILLSTIYCTRLYKFQLSSEVSGPLNKALADNAIKDAISCLGIGDILLQCIVLNRVVLCCVVLCCVVLCCIVLYCVVLYCTVLYCIVLY